MAVMIQELMDQWRKKGEEVGKLAAQGKAWMSVVDVVEEFTDSDFQDNDDIELSQMNQAGWEETDHFSHWYGTPMMDDAMDCLDTDFMDDKVIELFQDFKNEFWEGYENESGIYDALKAERVKRGL